MTKLTAIIRYVLVIIVASCLCIASTLSSDVELMRLTKNVFIQKPTIDVAELRCMELNIHYEARGESYLGKQAVANVTLNRVMSGKFPHSICKVVYQPYQFSWVKTNPSHNSVRVDRDVRKIALAALNRSGFKDVTRGALYFHNQEVEGFNRVQTTTIGNHIFYR